MTKFKVIKRGRAYYTITVGKKAYTAQLIKGDHELKVDGFYQAELDDLSETSQYGKKLKFAIISDLKDITVEMAAKYKEACRTVNVSFSYDPELVDAVKSLEWNLRKWDSMSKVWVVKASALNELLNRIAELAGAIKVDGKSYDFSVTKAVVDEILNEDVDDDVVINSSTKPINIHQDYHPLVNPSKIFCGWCDKCQSYCFGDCES